ncbi:MAG: class I SAM-dependent methyltransferase [Verrucomicrobia bacterium]|nr:class I SAM-dependent methyltransferase [Verrucomicrobiota bacterium]
MSSCGYRTIEKCRMSGNTHLIPVLSLGEQSLTGVFPKSLNDPVTKGPLELVWCPTSGLLQLRHSFDAGEMYGEGYGYRSGLNASMVDHLAAKAKRLERMAGLKAGDTVLDIGSSDATLLKSYTTSGLRRVGMDPSAEKYRTYYLSGIQLIPDFFSAEQFQKVAGSARPALITSVAMFYDLEDPALFVREIASLLPEGGIWHFEQSYMPTMLRQNSYDTICHEHLEYYSLEPVLHLLQEAGLRPVEVLMNSINGGSFAVTAVKGKSSYPEDRRIIDWLLSEEDRMGLHSPAPFRAFEERVFHHRESLRRLILSLRADGKRILGYGASTKGNVILQFCGLGPSEIEAVVDVNPAKHGRFTPGSGIPIISEEDGKKINPDYYLVLPWHFRDFILKKEAAYLAQGGRMIFPMPEIEIVTA